MPPSKACSVLPELGTHGEPTRRGLPKRQQQLMLLTVRKGPSPRCSPRHDSQCEHNRIKIPTMSRWPLLTLEHVQADGEPWRIGEGETRASSSSDAATLTVGPMGAMAPTSTSPRSVLVGAYRSMLAALPLSVSCGKSVGHPFAHSSQKYLRSIMGG